MARGGRGVHHQAHRKPDLTGIISAAEKTDLLTLVTAITGKLDGEISSIFDATTVTSLPFENGHHHWLSRSLFQPHNKENVPPSSKLAPLAWGDGPGSYSGTHQPVNKQEKETLPPQLRELKKEALGYYRKWQTVILQRLRDMQVRESNIPPNSVRGRGRGVRGAIRGRGNFRGDFSTRPPTHATGSTVLPPIP